MGNACAICKKKPTVNKIQTQTTTQHIFEKKREVRNGFCRIYPGVRCGDKSYSSPVLALHTWSKDSSSSKTHGSTVGTVNQSGGFLGPERSNSVLTSTSQKQETNVAIDETIDIIPIEDVLSVKAETAVKKKRAQQTQRRLKTPPPEDLSCGEKTKKWCMTNVCCCCCTPAVAPLQVVETKQDEQSASRVITFTIERVKYSNVDTPSTVKAVAATKQNDFYEKKLREEEIKFYYLRNEEVNETNFNSKMREAETLARVITQIKGMSSHYPDPAELQQILKQQEAGYFGFEYNEDIASTAVAGKVTSTNKSVIHEE